ncbi:MULTISPECIES: hypothetical protein [Streptomyces]|jgi:hypothetical protein|uniref:Lipoprotein n=2 Tax=Streptomyces griseoaurantiacus TaxID=68213 RepID=A0A7W2DPX3_9ACTN|nr:MULTISPECIES: hypothetical protein [Streptomyces]MBA5220833.1 hypothetical protein [Streptomyces griseoaurantiacus]MCF0086069.1 hypothetical protein [Streptomyces sp. MH192]MCF0099389.1 hypothetical protein [Streptomyces sp. MH191]NJP70244.1 hypothetical protein [Streptomyces sp. C1-2]
MLPGMPKKKLLLLTCAALLAAAAVGCSSGHTGGRDEGVVSTAESGGGKGGATKGPSADPAEAGRPQLRLDTTPLEELRLYQGYLHCIKDRGVDVGRGTQKMPEADPKMLWFPGIDVAEERPEVEKACIGKKPLTPPETDPKRNPHYMDDYNEWIACDNRKGFKVEPLPDGGGWNYAPHATPPRDADRIDQECMREAFGGK